MIQVLIVDRQPEVRRGLHMRLAIEPDIAVVGETGHVEQALALAHSLHPDVVVVDAATRGLTSVEIIQRLGAASPRSAIVVLSLGSDEETRAQAQEAGAQAFLDKGGGAADLLETIRQLAARAPRRRACRSHPVGNASALRGLNREQNPEWRV